MNIDLSITNELQYLLAHDFLLELLAVRTITLKEYEQIDKFNAQIWCQKCLNLNYLYTG